MMANAGHQPSGHTRQLKNRRPLFPVGWMNLLTAAFI
jgi:hypothetical protein